MGSRRLALGVVLALLALGTGTIGRLVARSALTPPATPLDAGRAWFVPRDTAGIPDRAIDDGARVLASVEVAAGKRMILYAWRPSATTPATALSAVPLGLEYRHAQLLPWWPRRGWQPAGTAGRRAVRRLDARRLLRAE